jgi:hypothetical protein
MQICIVILSQCPFFDGNLLEPAADDESVFNYSKFLTSSKVRRLKKHQLLVVLRSNFSNIIHSDCSGHILSNILPRAHNTPCWVIRIVAVRSFYIYQEKRNYDFIKIYYSYTSLTTVKWCSCEARNYVLRI